MERAYSYRQYIEKENALAYAQSVQAAQAAQSSKSQTTNSDQIKTISILSSITGITAIIYGFTFSFINIMNFVKK